VLLESCTSILQFLLTVICSVFSAFRLLVCIPALEHGIHFDDVSTGFIVPDPVQCLPSIY